jgi:ABC-type branched-subunit amino acid transport system ATPase component
MTTVEPETSSAVAALAATDVTVRFGGLTANANTSLNVMPGQFVGLVGPNGAGKSTLFSVLSGIHVANQGRVHMGGKDVTRVSAQKRARRGLARTFQLPEIFVGLSVREHLVLAHRSRHQHRRLWADMFSAGALRPGSSDEKQHVETLLDDLMLRSVADRPAESLPLGTSRLVEIGRALATSPSVLLLDEPLSGLDVSEARQLGDTLSNICREKGVAVLMVEHDVAAVLRLCSKVYVLDFGQLIAAGTPSEIRSDPKVQAAYLGDEVSGGDGKAGL